MTGTSVPLGPARSNRPGIVEAGAAVRAVRCASLSCRERSLTTLLLRVTEGVRVRAGRAAPERSDDNGTVGATPRFTSALSLRIVAGTRDRSTLSLALDDVAVRALLDPVLGTDAFDTLGENLAGAALACALDPWLARLEAAGGEPLVIRDVSRPGADRSPEPFEPADACRLALSLPVPGGGRADVRLVCDTATATTLTGLLGSMDAVPAPEGFADVPVPVRFDLGESELSGGELGALEAVDVVLLARCRYAADRTLDVRLGECHRVRGQLVDRRVQLIGTGETFLEDTGETDARGDEVDRIALRLGFELGESEISTGELRRLKAGAVFDLGGDPDKPVIMRCNGRVVGYGELVEIDGERYGVRVIERID